MDPMFVNSVTVANSHLINKRQLTIEHEVHFSDGAASQFKSKTPFADVAASSTEYGFPCEKHFFGSRHGKGPCDGEFGVVKRTVSQGVAARQAIVSDAKEFHDYAKAKLSKPKDEKEASCSDHKMRTFFYVEGSDVERQRFDRINAKPIPQTRKLHAVKPCSEGTLGVATRNLSCFCLYCTGSQSSESSCQSIDHVDDWKPQVIKKTPSKGTAKTSKKSKKTPSKSNKKSAKPSKTIKRRYPKSSEGTANSSKKSKAASCPTAPLNIEVNEMTRSEYFRKALVDLQSFDAFEELQDKCKILVNDPNYEEYKIETDDSINIVDNQLAADRFAYNILPKQKLPQDFCRRLPVRVYADGNCLPRSLSVACFGHEDAHVEMRVRIVVEMCTNCDVYTDNEYLNKGIVLPQNEACRLLESYTMFSDEYTPGDKITRSVARRIFEAEAMSVVKDGSYMGIWQLFCSASVAGVSILSVYPDLGDRLPKLLLHRTIMPRVFRTYQSEILIMWTSTREDLHPDGRNWIPNHFVPLLPQTGDSELLIDIDDVDDDYASISLDDSLIDHIVQSVLHAEPELLADAKPELHVAKPELYPDAKPKLSSATLSNPDHSQLEDFKRPLNGTSPSGKTLHSTHIGWIGALSHCDKEYPTSSDEMKPPFKGQTKKSPMKNPARNDNTDLPPSGQTGPQSTGKVESRSIDEAHPQSSCKTHKSPMLDFTTDAQTEPLPTDKRDTPPVGKTCPPSNSQADLPSIVKMDPLSSENLDPTSSGHMIPHPEGRQSPRLVAIQIKSTQ